MLRWIKATILVACFLKPMTFSNMAILVDSDFAENSQGWDYWNWNWIFRATTIWFCTGSIDKQSPVTKGRIFLMFLMVWNSGKLFLSRNFLDWLCRELHGVQGNPTIYKHTWWKPVQGCTLEVFERECQCIDYCNELAWIPCLVNQPIDFLSHNVTSTPEFEAVTQKQIWKCHIFVIQFNRYLLNCFQQPLKVWAKSLLTLLEVV